MLTELMDLFKAPSPITLAPQPVAKVGRVSLTEGPLTLLQSSELSRAISNYDDFTDDWLPHARRLDKLSALYISEDSNKFYQRALIDISMSDRFYRLQIFIKRYQPWIRTIEEISSRAFNKPKTIVFSNELIVSSYKR